MTETDVVDGYEISWHVYINLLFIYLGWAFKSKIESFIGYAEGTDGMLLRGNCALRVLRYRRALYVSLQCV